ncbi:G/T mismatches repair enzyme [uncultured archaeon]|nr:G/T mismatches repair enzyme [uncultured archaeon]
MQLYGQLLRKYGKQGWWPVIRKGKCVYHAGDYATPKTRTGQFQIVVGAILAQNTNWKNAEKALLSLQAAKMLSAEKLAAAPKRKIAQLIRSSGYYNQKAERLKTIAKLFPHLHRCKSLQHMRRLLLSTKGIGPETADSIMLYAFRQPVFVIDAYTRRFCKANHLSKSGDYEQLRSFFETNLPLDFRIFNECHALIVRWGKENRSQQLKTA